MTDAGSLVLLAAGGGLIGVLLAGGALGAVVGQRLEPHLSERRLRQGFASLLIGSALLVGVEALRHRGSTSGHQPQPQAAPDQPAPPPIGPAARCRPAEAIAYTGSGPAV